VPHTRSSTRVRGFDGLRGLAALGVVVLHVSFYTARARPPWDLGDGLLQGLRLGVVLFFALSGFLLARPWLQAARGEAAAPHVGRYLVRRAARILPAYYAALGLGTLVLLGTDNGRLPQGREIPALLLLVQNWSASAQEKLVPPAWTLCVEVSFYLVLPLAGLVLLRWGTTARRQLALVAGAVVASVAFNAVVSAWLPAQWHRTLPGAGYAFALGTAAAVVAGAWRPRRGGRVALTTAALALAVVDALADKTWHAPGMALVRDLPAAIGFALLLVAVAAGPSRLLGSAPLRWLGSRSYALYLVHYPVILLFTARHALPQSSAPATLLVLAAALVLSELLTRAVEQPIVRLVHRRTATEATRAPKRHARHAPRRRPASAVRRRPGEATA
jgi:peptidoglycan/LPS O-acetylase OafA/YrhL